MKKVWSKIVASVVLVSAVMAFAMPVQAADAKGKGFSGQVVKADAAKGELLVKKVTETNKFSKSFKVDDKTKITGADGKALTLGDLKSGDKVDVSYADAGKVSTAIAVTVKK